MRSSPQTCEYLSFTNRPVKIEISHTRGDETNHPAAAYVSSQSGGTESDDDQELLDIIDHDRAADTGWYGHYIDRISHVEHIMRTADNLTRIGPPHHPDRDRSSGAIADTIDPIVLSLGTGGTITSSSGAGGQATTNQRIHAALLDPMAHRATGQPLPIPTNLRVDEPHILQQLSEAMLGRHTIPDFKPFHYDDATKSCIAWVHLSDVQECSHLRNTFAGEISNVQVAQEVQDLRHLERDIQNAISVVGTNPTYLPSNTMMPTKDWYDTKTMANANAQRAAQADMQLLMRHAGTVPEMRYQHHRNVAPTISCRAARYSNIKTYWAATETTAAAAAAGARAATAPVGGLCFAKV